MTQFVKVRFGQSSRLYTYQSELDPLEPGDDVIIPARSGGEATVTVVEVSDERPSDVPEGVEFKAVIRKAVKVNT